MPLLKPFQIKLKHKIKLQISSLVFKDRIQSFVLQTSSIPAVLHKQTAKMKCWGGISLWCCEEMDMLKEIIFMGKMLMITLTTKNSPDKWQDITVHTHTYMLNILKYNLTPWRSWGKVKSKKFLKFIVNCYTPWISWGYNLGVYEMFKVALNIFWKSFRLWSFISDSK